MKNSDNKRYVYLMLSFFGAISLSIVVFFVVYRFRGIGDWVRTLTQILAPFIYGGLWNYYTQTPDKWQGERAGERRRICKFFAAFLEI